MCCNRCRRAPIEGFTNSDEKAKKMPRTPEPKLLAMRGVGCSVDHKGKRSNGLIKARLAVEKKDHARNKRGYRVNGKVESCVVVRVVFVVRHVVRGPPPRGSITTCPGPPNEV